MWYKKADIPEYDVMHGSPYSQSIHSKGFVYEFLGKGLEQYGPGFYFTTSHDTAHLYTRQPLHKDDLPQEKTPGIIKAKVTLNKPIKVEGFGEFHSDFYPSLNRTQTRAFIQHAVKLYGTEFLSNYGEISFEGIKKVIENAVDIYANNSSIGALNDLFQPSDYESALRLIKRFTGFDGVEVNFHEEKWIVAWFPEQIQIIKE